MDLGMIGLGKMGANMARRLLSGGHRVVGYGRRKEVVDSFVEKGGEGAYSLEELARKLPKPRVAWMMVPAGEAVDLVIDGILPYLSPGDILVDGGNSYYKDSMRRAKELGERGIKFLDVGVSGGIWGGDIGYCLMVGGDEEAYRYLEPVFRSLSQPDGYAYVGPSGAGHFVKMVHNGIEYGIMQAYGEGFELLRAKEEFGFDLKKIADLWIRGSVIRSWLLELISRVLSEDPELSGIRGWVEDSGEGRWTVMESLELGIPLNVISGSLYARFRSRQEDSFAAKLIAALRKEFGGHEVRRR